MNVRKYIIHRHSLVIIYTTNVFTFQNRRMTKKIINTINILMVLKEEPKVELETLNSVLMETSNIHMYIMNIK